MGGALAQFVAASNHISAVTFNAPGVNMPTNGDASKIINYVNMNDFIGCLNSHLGETRYYLPDGKYMDNEFKPHSDYINQNFENYKTLPEGYEWTFGNAIALWGYDIQNKNAKQKFLLSPFVTEDNLADALRKINSVLEEPEKYSNIRISARETIKEKYKLQKLLKEQINFLNSCKIRA